MTVFKGYMKIAKRNIGFIIMYVSIFLFVSTIMQAMAGKSQFSSYSAARLTIAVVDGDGGTLSLGLQDYLKQYHQVVPMENNEEVMQEALYYATADLVIRIPPDFQKHCLDEGEPIKLSKIPGNYDSIYAQQQINTFLNEVKTYMASGKTLEESLTEISRQPESEVTLIDLNGNAGQIPGYVYVFRYVPYMFLAALCYVLGLILNVFQAKDIKSRTLVSATRHRRQVGESILAFLLLGTMLFLVNIVVTIVLNGMDFLNAPNMIYYTINSFIMMLVSLSLAFLLGMFVSSPTMVNSIVTPLSLGMCFFCGVFVPLEFLGNGVKYVAQFLPVYWYEVNVDLLAEYQSIQGSVRDTIFKGYGIQLLFALAFTGIALAVGKYRKQMVS